MNNLNTIPNPPAQNRSKGSKQAAAAGKSQSPGSAKNVSNVQNTTAPQTPTAPQGDKCREVCFELNAGSAQEVLLAGDFTGWEKTPIKLRKGDRGAWQATVKLPPGQYHYRYVVDGQWQDDPSASSSIPNPYGSSNSVLKIT